jgi:hypothetical protein
VASVLWFERNDPRDGHQLDGDQLGEHVEV